VKLKPFARTALWAGGGAYVGILLGSILIDPERAAFWMAPWTIAFALYAVLVIRLGREPPERAVPVAAVAGPATAPAAAPLRVALSFPDVPAGYPPVVGVEDALRVGVRVERDGPAAGAAVRLAAQLRDGPGRFVAGEGVAGTDGTVAFTIKAPGVGELLLDAEASLDGARAEARSSVSVVRYSEEIERLFHEFRAYAQGVLGPASASDTARELAEKLRGRLSGPAAGRALLELARIYELVAYGERDADRRLYLALVGALLVLERDEGAPADARRAVTAPEG
jgi:hypothetical protein